MTVHDTYQPAIARFHGQWRSRVGAAVAVLLFCSVALAAPPEPTTPPEPAAQAQWGAAAEVQPGAASGETEAAGISPWEIGPKTVALGHDVTVGLGPDYRYLPPGPAAKLMEQNGSFHNEGILGLFASNDPSHEWFVVARFDDEGFIKDDEELDADDLLSALRDGVEEMNEERKQRGFSALTLDGWAEAPRYDQAKHQLVWALIVADPEGKSVNLNTRILGRRGYVSLNLVTDPVRLADYRHHAAALLGATRFDSGARYEDFDEKTDKIAEYGLTGLIMAGAGLGAAKLVKIGLLAKFSKVIIGLLIAGKKAIVLALIGLGVLVKKFFGAKDSAPSADAGPGDRAP
jgi:uncharacterized membrane-anchored protein